MTISNDHIFFSNCGRCTVYSLNEKKTSYLSDEINKMD